MRARLLLLAWIVLALPAAAGAQQATLRGHVTLAVEGASLADTGPMIVYLATPSGQIDFDVPEENPSIAQKDASFAPGFLVVTAGQVVAFPNDDEIFHNVFSYSRPNDFDLGVYPRGESRSVTMTFPGFVRIYCSIHESMSASVFVAPSPWWALADADGRYEIRGVPPGRYTVRTWSQRLPSAKRAVVLETGEQGRLDLAVGHETPRTGAAPLGDRP